jgi:hypothetical protein
MITISLLQEYLNRNDMKIQNFQMMPNNVIGVICSNDASITNIVIPVFVEEYNHWLANRREKTITELI